MTRSLPGLLVGRVTLERTGHRELAELVANHVLTDQNGHVLATVMHRDGQADHLGQNHRTTRPGLDRLAAVRRNRFLHLLREMRIAEGAFMYWTGHFVLPPLNPAYLALRPRTIMLLVRLFLRVL